MPNDHSESIYCDELVWLQQRATDCGQQQIKLTAYSQDKSQSDSIATLTLGNKALPQIQNVSALPFGRAVRLKTIRNPSTYLRTEHVLTLEIDRCQTY